MYSRDVATPSPTDGVLLSSPERGPSGTTASEQAWNSERPLATAEAPGANNS